MKRPNLIAYGAEVARGKVLNSLCLSLSLSVPFSLTLTQAPLFAYSHVRAGAMDGHSAEALQTFCDTAGEGSPWRRRCSIW